MRIAMIIIIVITMSTTSVTGYTIPPIQEAYGPNEIMWIGGSGDSMVLLWGNGSLGYGKSDCNELTLSLGFDQFDYGRTQLILSRQEALALCVVQTMVASYDLTFVGLSTGKIKGKTTVSQSMPREFIGYDKDATSFYVRSGKQLHYINVATGAMAQVGEIKGVDSMSCQVRMLQDGNDYLVIDGWNIIARNMAGKELWRKSLGDKVHGEMTDKQPSWPWMTLFCESISDDSKMWYECIDMRTGKEVWKRHVPMFGDLAAVSDDGKRQAWSTPEGMTITQLPDERAVKTRDITWRAEGVFLDNGKTLACVPALESGRIDPKTNTYTLKRKSQDIWFIDTASGATIKRISAKKPATPDPNRPNTQPSPVRNN